MCRRILLINGILLSQEVTRPRVGVALASIGPEIASEGPRQTSVGNTKGSGVRARNQGEGEGKPTHLLGGGGLPSPPPLADGSGQCRVLCLCFVAPGRGGVRRVIPRTPPRPGAHIGHSTPFFVLLRAHRIA